MTLKELFAGIDNDVKRGFETRRITMVIVRGRNNRIPYGVDIIKALDSDHNSGGYVFMCDPDVPENIIPAYKSALEGDISEAFGLFKRSVKNQITAHGRDKFEGFSVLHVENANIRELQKYAECRVSVYSIFRIPVPKTVDCYLYAEIEDNMLITGESQVIYDEESALYEEIMQQW